MKLYDPYLRNLMMSKKKKKKKNNGIIKNYAEMQAVKKELRDRVYIAEQDYIKGHEWITFFLNLAGVHKHKANQRTRENIHAGIIQSITEFIKGKAFFKKYKDDYTKIIIPFVLTVITAIIVRKL